MPRRPPRNDSLLTDPVAPLPDLDAFREAQLALFDASVLKQAKWRAISSAVGDTGSLQALDLGSDNGVISWLLRRRGGRWTSADLTDETVAAISAMTGEPARRLDGAELPFPDSSFDLIVVIDLLEHVDDDRRLLHEISRCLRPGGRAVLHVPTAKRWGLLPPVRHAMGLTDAWHGHLHSGYDRRALLRLAPPELRLVSLRTYSRFFSHLLDTALNLAFLRRSGGRARSTAKGVVVTGHDIDRGDLGTLRRAYPALRAFAALDVLLPWTRGYMSIVQLLKVPSTRPS